MAGPYGEAIKVSSVPSSDDDRDSLAMNLDTELDGLTAVLDQELSNGGFYDVDDDPYYLSRHDANAAQDTAMPSPDSMGLGGSEDMDMPIYATVDKLTKKRPDDTGHARAPAATVPEIVVEHVDMDNDEVDQPSEEEERYGVISKSNKGVSFTSDTVDNEGVSRRYRKERVQLGDIHRGRISSQDAVLKNNPIYVDDDDVPSRVFVNRDVVTGRSLTNSPPNGTASIPVGDRGYDGSVISYQYQGGTSVYPQTVNTLPQPGGNSLNAIGKPTTVQQFVPHTVERVGLPPPPTVDWSTISQDQGLPAGHPGNPFSSDQGISIRTHDNVSVISISSSSRGAAVSPNTSVTRVNPSASPTLSTEPVPPSTHHIDTSWPAKPQDGGTTFEDLGQGYQVLIDKTVKHDRRVFLKRLAVFILVSLLVLAVGAGVAVYFFARD